MKKALIILIMIGMLFVPKETYAKTGVDFMNLFTDQTLDELKEGEKINFSDWNEIVVSITEKEINEILIDGLLKNYIVANLDIMPKKAVFQSAIFNMEKENLNITVLFGKLKLRCEAQVELDTTDDQILSIQNPRLRIFGITLPKFITRWILKDFTSYSIAYKDIIGPDSPVQVNRIVFHEGFCKVTMGFPEDKVVELFETVVPKGPVEILKDKRITDYVSLEQLDDIHLYIAEDTVNRIFNEQLALYVEGGDTVIPKGLHIRQVSVSLKDQLLTARIEYMGIGLNVQAEFDPFCQNNVVGIDMKELYLDGQQIPSSIKVILEQFTKNVRFDLSKAGMPSFIRLKGLTCSNHELDVNLSFDLLDREPIKLQQLAFLLGTGVQDQNAFFEYFAPTDSLDDAVDRFLTVALLQSAVDNILDKAIIPEGVDLLINKDLIRVTDVSLIVADRSVLLGIRIWNMPMELQCRFSLTSDKNRTDLFFFEPVILFDGQAVPEKVVNRIIGEGLKLTATFSEISEFLLINELAVRKFALEEKGLVIQFAIK